jgi:hypothetical protein
MRLTVLALASTYTVGACAPERDVSSTPGQITGPSGERLTILVAKTVYAVGEEVLVVHVHEATAPGAELYVMGPALGPDGARVERLEDRGSVATLADDGV